MHRCETKKNNKIGSNRTIAYFRMYLCWIEYENKSNMEITQTWPINMVVNCQLVFEWCVVTWRHIGFPFSHHHTQATGFPIKHISLRLIRPAVVHDSAVLFCLIANRSHIVHSPDDGELIQFNTEQQDQIGPHFSYAIDFCSFTSSFWGPCAAGNLPECARLLRV